MSLKLVVSPIIQRDIRQLISFSIKITISVPFSKYHTFIFIKSEEVKEILKFKLLICGKHFTHRLTWSYSNPIWRVQKSLNLCPSRLHLQCRLFIVTFQLHIWGIPRDIQGSFYK
jgi:hypothetical protein